MGILVRYRGYYEIKSLRMNNMKIKRNKGNGINFADVEIGIAFEDCDGNVYIKIADHELLNKD